MIEPGRSIVGSAGVLLTKVLYRKKSPSKEFVIVDAAMNDLIRPALYNAHHEILPLNHLPEAAIVADVVGPVCETGDFLARDRAMADVQPGEYMAICPPAPMVSYSRRITIRGRGLPKCWSKAANGGSCGHARRGKIW